MQKTLNCNSCGSPGLEQTGQNLFRCGHCGSVITVQPEQAKPAQNAGSIGEAVKNLKQAVAGTVTAALTEAATAVTSAFSEVKSVEIQYGRTTVTKREFANRWLLKQVIIPETVTSVQKFAFAKSRKIAVLTLPYSVDYVGKKAFKGWTAAQVLYVNKEKSLLWDKKWNKGCRAQIIYG